MHWQYSPYAPPLILSAAVSLFLAVLAWRRRPARGALPITILMLAGVGARISIAVTANLRLWRSVTGSARLRSLTHRRGRGGSQKRPVMPASAYVRRLPSPCVPLR